MPELEPVAVPVLEPHLLHDVASVFGLLSATARLQIMWLLSAGPRDVGTLAADLGQPVAAVSQHLAKLKLGGLVRARRQGRRRIYAVDDEVMGEVVRMVVARLDGGGAAGAARRVGPA
ncbi:ArsR/SmtB family transcription factor [Pseudonocardia lacus]|uniref:ArsR/SmtB family transcription factor n=1 Tax=Pseudonocardia lacus TaxID=2835865 RepID=UPI0027E335D8|nr:metalloregulator ArsR/SmtB family transcription factor [Pseudonocardia lacus]